MFPEKLPQKILDLRNSIFYIYDKSDLRVLAVLNDIAGFQGRAFRQTSAGWEVMDKYISKWDIATYPDRYDYTKEWGRAIAMAEKEETK